MIAEFIFKVNKGLHKNRMVLFSVEVVGYILFGCNDGYVTSVNGSGTLGNPHLLENPCTTALR